MMQHAVSDAEFLPPGHIIADRYRVGDVVGRGSQGIVYVGEHVRVGRRVAIKVLSRALSSNTRVRERFEAEVRAASVAGHPNVIQVFDVGELQDSRLYSVMEFVEGRDLYALLLSEGELSLERACRLIRDVVFGVRAAHAQGIVHRDLKLENVMVQSVTEGEFVKVLDFGIAAGVNMGTRSTAVGTVLGTPAYMAPEQADGARPTVQFDIYAIGVMLFELLTTRLPIEHDHPLTLMSLKGCDPAPRVSGLRPDVPPSLDQLVGDCLEIDPDQRPASCEIFLERLNLVVAEIQAAAPQPVPTLLASPAPAPVPAPVPEPAPSTPQVHITPPLEHAARPTTSKRSFAWVALGLMLLLAIGVGLFFQFQNRQAPELVEAEPASPEPEPPTIESVSGGSSPTPDPAELAVPHDPAPDPEPNPNPAVVAVKPQNVDPAPVDPVQTEQVHDTPHCKKVRTAALDGRRAHDWDNVLEATRERECWPRTSDRKKFETQAYMELGRFADCLRSGKNLDDTEASKWVTLCSKRLAG